ncbi:hypothetical protein C8J56DRAFT_977310 [Mycena floridula]|nr:hypothetical protein C8J56DRAFT_977310 [Mycena floridula]
MNQELRFGDGICVLWILVRLNAAESIFRLVQTRERKSWKLVVTFFFAMQHASRDRISQFSFVFPADWGFSMVKPKERQHSVG